MILVILLLGYHAHLGDACSCRCNREGPGKGLAMQSVVSTVCDNWESGTDDTVWIRFKSTKSMDGLKESFNYNPWLSMGSNSHCITERLEKENENNWANWRRDSTQTWGYERREDFEHNYLGSCAKDLRPTDHLEFRVVMPDKDFLDDLEICHLKVTFGSKGLKGSSTWEWKRTDGPPGEGAWTKSWLKKYGIFPAGPQMTHWLKMKKTADLA